jgi:hypothetical protein
VNVTKLWYRIDNVTLGEFDTDGDFIARFSWNVVNTGHTWIASVIGAKYVHVLYDVNGNTLSDDQALLTSRAELTGIANLRVAKMVNNALVWQLNDGAAIQAGMVYSLSETGAAPRYTAYAHLELGDAEFMIDMNDDGVSEVWSGLAGKTVYFYNNIATRTRRASPRSPRSSPGCVSDIRGYHHFGYPESPMTGLRVRTIKLTNKGYQYIYAVAVYVEQPGRRSAGASQLAR